MQFPVCLCPRPPSVLDFQIELHIPTLDQLNFEAKDRFKYGGIESNVKT